MRVVAGMTGYAVKDLTRDELEAVADMLSAGKEYYEERTAYSPDRAAYLDALPGAQLAALIVKELEAS